MSRHDEITQRINEIGPIPAAYERGEADGRTFAKRELRQVYVLEHGEYEQRMVYGVFSSLETAMAAYPGEWRQLDDWVNDTWVPGTTRWSNGEYDLEAYDLDAR